MNRLILLTLGLCWLGVALPLRGENSRGLTLRDTLVTTRQATVEKCGGKVTVRFELIVPARAIRSNYRHLFLPELVAADTTLAPRFKASLPPLSLVGNRKSRSERRHVALDVRSRWMDGRALAHKRAQADTLPAYLSYSPGDTTRYEASIPYEEWMGTQPLHLWLNHEKWTYNRYWKRGNHLLLGSVQLQPLSGAGQHLTEANATTESDSTRRHQEDWRLRQELAAAQSIPDSENYELFFHVGHSRIDSSYANNAVTLQNILRTLQTNPVGGQRGVRKIQIQGQASPEGGYGTNVRLALARSKALKQYLRQHTSLPDTLFETSYTEPSWPEVRRQILADSQVPSRVEVIRIIDQTLPGTERDTQLRELQGGRAYRYLNEHFFRPLRNAAYVNVFFEPQTPQP